MSWWGRLLGGASRNEPGSRRVDYLSEAMALERQGDLEAALTSYRLAIRADPRDAGIHVSLAIVYSRTGRLEDAIRSYRRALELAPDLGGAHYGLSFLLLKRGDRAGAEQHLKAFLAAAPTSEGMTQWVRHAEETLARLRSESDGTTPPAAEA